MAQAHITLPKEQLKFVDTLIKNGRFQTRSEVLRDALRYYEKFVIERQKPVSRKKLLEDYEKLMKKISSMIPADTNVEEIIREGRERSYK